MIGLKTELALKKAVELETENATIRYGERYHSLHEGESVLLEEIEEAEVEMQEICNAWKQLHIYVHENNTADVLETVKKLGVAANLLLCEVAQIAAVSEKLKRGTET